MGNKVQNLFDKLVEGYNLRAIKIGDETWYAMNDLPLDRKAINRKMSDLRKDLSSNGDFECTPNFVEKNTRLITNSTVILNHLRNFDKVHNTGEMFGNFTMINYIVMTSRLGYEYKIEMINLLNEIRKNDFYVDENIKPEQIEKLEQEVERLKDKLLYERTRKGLGALDIVKFININDLLPSSLFVFMSEYLKLGTYLKVNKNRRFKPNDNFIEKCSKHGVAIIGTGNIIFYESFAEAINKNPKVLEILKRINENEIQIREQGIKNKNEKSE